MSGSATASINDGFGDELAAACEVVRQRCCESASLPFVVIDPENADNVLSVWSVKPSGNLVSDLATGLVYAEDLIQRSKQFPYFYRRQCIEAVLTAIAQQGRVSPVEQAFLGRIAMLAAAGSLS